MTQIVTEDTTPSMEAQFGEQASPEDQLVAEFQRLMNDLDNNFSHETYAKWDDFCTRDNIRTLIALAQSGQAAQLEARAPDAYPKMTIVRGHKYTCANVQIGSSYEDKCDCGALDTAGNAIPLEARALADGDAVAWRELLRPFAKYAETLDECYPTPHGDEFEIAARICSPNNLRELVTITLGELRAARAALTHPAPLAGEDGLVERLTAEAEECDQYASSGCNVDFVEPMNAWDTFAARFREAAAALSQLRQQLSLALDTVDMNYHHCKQAEERAEAYEATVLALREALSRQCDNMAFVINHADIYGWDKKFLAELEEDRAALEQAKPSALTTKEGSSDGH